jgi:hypothetical protein
MLEASMPQTLAFRDPADLSVSLDDGERHSSLPELDREGDADRSSPYDCNLIRTH